MVRNVRTTASRSHTVCARASPLAPPPHDSEAAIDEALEALVDAMLSDDVAGTRQALELARAHGLEHVHTDAQMLVEIERRACDLVHAEDRS